MASFHKSTFQYLKPTEKQFGQMDHLRNAATDYAVLLDWYLPPGADKTYILRQLRTISMWANVALTRLADGTPRTEESINAPDT